MARTTKTQAATTVETPAVETQTAKAISQCPACGKELKTEWAEQIAQHTERCPQFQLQQWSDEDRAEAAANAEVHPKAGARTRAQKEMEYLLARS